MITKQRKQSYFLYCCLFFIIISAGSCEKFLEVEAPTSTIDANTVFQDDVTALSALAGIYIELMNANSYASGGLQSVTQLSGLSSDEMVVGARSNLTAIEFEQNAISPENTSIASLWESMYKVVYGLNALMEGVNKSTAITKPTGDQIAGEALFLRAFSYFYLVNIFGDIPIVLTTDYTTNKNLSRNDAEEIYVQIKQDLTTAKSLLLDKYPSSRRARINKFAVSALLARVNLFLQNWSDAEDYASEVIANNATYILENDLNKVFLATSKEAIWQLIPVAAGYNTYEGNYFIVGQGNLYNVLSDTLINAFEDDDRRFMSWVGLYDNGTDTLYYPFKYKVQQGTTITEYSVVMRLAEMYLIRAEARINLNDLSNAIADIDAIRNRAGLPLVASTNPLASADELRTILNHERQTELFSEWGHRWFDLKRLNRSTEILSPIKTEWSVNDTIYPIPALELSKNKKMGDQNAGY